MQLSSKDKDYAAFEDLLQETWESRPLPGTGIDASGTASTKKDHHGLIISQKSAPVPLFSERGTGALIDRREQLR